jgi:hypothetical protein
LHAKIQETPAATISIKNDTKTRAQKKERLIWGITKPAKERPSKVKPVILNSEIRIGTMKSTSTFTTHLKAPKVIKFIGVKSKLRTGFTIKFRRVRLKAAQKRITRFSE